MKKVIFLLIIWLFAFAACKKENNPPIGKLTYAGKTYKTAIIDGKEWMAENLAYLPTVYPSSNGSYPEPRYYVYDYQGSDVAAAKATANYTTYGVLYNWTAALVACPPGWHLPSKAEWEALTTFLGGKWVAGGKLKEIGYSDWRGPNSGATNEMGFTALPAGWLNYYDGNFFAIGLCGRWWSSTEYNADNVIDWGLSYNSTFVDWSLSTKGDCLSVRCVKD